jgi:hypothetical protein
MSTTLYHTANSVFLERALYENKDGTVKNVSGHTSFIKVGKYYGDGLSVTIPGAFFTDGTDGIFAYTVSADVLAVLGFGAHVYSRYLVEDTLPPVEPIDPEDEPLPGKVVSVVSGSFIIIPAV